ncbi:MAG: hypothetical protein I8H75_03500 [Myxococcaceae bacterium]|nr:hypothetical protein [Myxococcaceae bacterium]MBH2006393.1 hypothetical protein [Myxococcaceae bacterium]
MKKHTEIVQHLPIEEVKKRYQTCQGAREKSWWQALWLRMKGQTTTEVSEIIGCKPDWFGAGMKMALLAFTNAEEIMAESPYFRLSNSLNFSKC